MNPVQLTKDLVAIKSINPEHGEKKVAEMIGLILENNGFEVRYYEYAPGRVSLVAHKTGYSDKLPLCFAGHTDTVPLGNVAWSKDPFAGEEEGDKLYGRGSADMKSGLAAMTTAAIKSSQKGLKSGLTLIYAAGEETGCEGGFHLAGLNNVLHKVGAMVIAEPTSNYPLIGHKGALWLKACLKGITAHGSMPEEGVNAIYKAVNVIERLRGYHFSVKPHPLLNLPTLNVGTIKGGINTNSVPDRCEFTIDIRTTPHKSNDEIFKHLKEYLGMDVNIDPLVNVEGIATNPDDPWVQSIFDLLIPYSGKKPTAKGVNYFTDASVLTKACGNPPTIILGPGEATLAHKTDEYCLKSNILESEDIFIEMIKQWNQ